MTVTVKFVNGTEQKINDVDDCMIKKNSITYARELLEVKRGNISSWFNWSHVISVICEED